MCRSVLVEAVAVGVCGTDVEIVEPILVQPVPLRRATW
jgi:threonine dehydrogenase-like Zn-dependent dehydrogenase